VDFFLNQNLLLKMLLPFFFLLSFFFFVNCVDTSKQTIGEREYPIKKGNEQHTDKITTVKLHQK
jgi:hypothetical protein